MHVEFKGVCHAVRLVQRAPGDLHVSVSIWTEDDGNWFVSKDKTGFSSSWAPELLSLLESAVEWMKKNCDPDVTSHGCRRVQYGWKFRSNDLPSVPVRRRKRKGPK